MGPSSSFLGVAAVLVDKLHVLCQVVTDALLISQPEFTVIAQNGRGQNLRVRQVFHNAVSLFSVVPEL